MRDYLTRREFVKVAAAMYLSKTVLGDQTVPSSQRRPNMVFVFPDQMRASAMGCMGNQQVRTPHMDKLAGEGLLVNNMISSHPLCTPYRAQLMTGLYGPTSGVLHNDIRMPDDLKILPTQLKAAGYTTGYIGKWHLAQNRKNPVDAVNRRGWDFWAVRNCSHDYYHTEYWLNDSQTSVKVAGWEPDAQTDLAVEFIKKQSGQTDPFCLMVSFGPPHNPYKSPEKYLKDYDADKIELPPNTLATEGNRERLRQYYGMVTGLDDCLGRILRSIADAGAADDTIVIFTSDHGDMLGAQGHILKQRPWEESIHVPLIVRYPRQIKAGRRKDWQIDSIDLMPTLLGFAGAEIPAGVQGLNQAGLLLGRGTPKRDASLLMNNGGTGGNSPGVEWRGIRTPQFTYAYHSGGDWVMYDNTKDPYQLKNLVNDPAYAEQKKKLHDQVLDLREHFKDAVPLLGTTPKPIKLPT